MQIKITLVYQTPGTRELLEVRSQRVPKNSNQYKTLTNPLPFWPTLQTCNAVVEHSQSITLREQLLNQSWADADFNSLLIKWCLFLWPH